MPYTVTPTHLPEVLILQPQVFGDARGFFYESLSKGGRQFFTFGVGLKYNLLGFDISYIATLKRTNPLANTLRFSIRFDIGDKGK